MKNKKYLLHLFVVLSLVSYTWFIESIFSIKILKHGPAKTIAGQDFNVQASGRSAMWLKVAGNIQKYMTLKWDDIDLDAKVNLEKEFVSVYIPKRLYAEAGKHTLSLISTVDGSYSNEVFFEVMIKNKP